MFITGERLPDISGYLIIMVTCILQGDVPDYYGYMYITGGRTLLLWLHLPDIHFTREYTRKAT